MTLDQQLSYLLKGMAEIIREEDLRERLTEGDTDSQAIGFLVARYGEFILLKPPFNWHTWLLWLMPPGVLVIGGLVAVRLGCRAQE